LSPAAAAESARTSRASSLKRAWNDIEDLIRRADQIVEHDLNAIRLQR
jgi:hypothetical protein